MTPREDQMADASLRASEAARVLGISTKALLTLMHEGKIWYVMQDGIAHIPVDSISEYRSHAS